MAAKLTREEKYMKAAIREAKKAWALGEVPIGCVIVYEDKIIGRGYNRRMVDHSALAHAEIAAIKKACKRMGDWRLEECELYVTPVFPVPGEQWSAGCRQPLFFRIRYFPL